MHFLDFGFLAYSLLYFEVFRMKTSFFGRYEIEFELYKVNKTMSNQVLSLKHRSHKLVLKIQHTIT